MIRLHVVAEGQTEEGFCNTVLFPYLQKAGIFPSVRLTWHGKRSTPGTRGGGAKNYQAVKGDIRRWMREDHAGDAWFTTMFDLYGLPADFPGAAQSKGIVDPYQRIAAIEKAFKDDVCAGDDRLWRFIPYLQLHEFEALLFSDPRQMEWEFIEAHQQRGIQSLVDLAESLKNPEVIDDGPETAPSKRIIRYIPEYKGRKSSAGPLVANKIGIELIRQRCGHFDAWLKVLEGLV
jgi:hypothetical protein